MNARIVLLSGKQGSGKTTLQKALAQEFEREPGTRAVTVNFADVIYEIAGAVDQIIGKYAPQFTLQARGVVKDGPLLQLLGTEWGRGTLDENIWVTCARGKVERVIEENKDASSLLIVLGDTRFENEFDAFPEALRVRLRCDEPIRKARCSMWRENTEHPSEVGLDRYAAENKFDLYFDTGIKPINECLNDLVTELRRTYEQG